MTPRTCLILLITVTSIHLIGYIFVILLTKPIPFQGYKSLQNLLFDTVILENGFCVRAASVMDTQKCVDKGLRISTPPFVWLYLERMLSLFRWSFVILTLSCMVDNTITFFLQLSFYRCKKQA